jgi:glycosyltransferase involved in cell wall biosynthesis
MQSPTISVIIPAYKAAGTIARAIDSILAQTLKATEICVIDDGSPDDIAGALRHYGDQVLLIRKPNGGASSARNLGIERTSGQLIAFLDADDYWEPAALEKRVAVFAADAQVAVVGSRWYEQVPGEERFKPYVENEAAFGRSLNAKGEEAFILGMCMWTSSLVIRRDMLGDWRFESGLEPAEDRELWIRLASTRTVHLVDEALATAVLEPNSLSRSHIDRDYGNMLRVVRHFADLLGPRGVRNQEAIVLRRWAARYLANRQPAGAVAPAWKRLKLQPLSPQAWWIACKASVLAKAS